MDSLDKAKAVQAIKEAVIICYKPYLTFQELMLYTGRKRTFLTSMLNSYGIKKTSTGYYNKTEVDQMLADGPKLQQQKAARINIKL